MLTDAAARKAAARDRDYKLADANGLSLFVSTKGHKSWRYKYRFGGKERRIVFGAYPEVTLKAAREMRDEARTALRKGRDPGLENRRARLARKVGHEDTFEKFAREWHELHKARWKPVHADDVITSMERDLFPEIGAYRPARRFGMDGEIWAESIEALLVWFTWLDPDLEKLCREAVNEIVFRGTKIVAPVDRQNLRVLVETGSGERHRLDQLSSGERQLVQLVVRIAAHMTGSTVVLVDEAEQHLHTVMQRRLLNLMKDWARQHEGLSFIMTSHQQESIRLLAPKLAEEGLHKSGCLVKPQFRAPR